MTINLKNFVRGYIDTALWSTIDSRDETGEDMYSLSDEFDRVSAPCYAAMQSDCEDFIKAQRRRLELFKRAMPGCDDDQLGSLFWLNRHRHGVGFWDSVNRSIPWSQELCTTLSDACAPYGSFDLYGDFEAGVVKSQHYG